MKLTRSKIAYDLSTSPYQQEMVYEGTQVVKYKFSSEMYQKNFIKRLQENRTKINDSLTKRFGYEIDLKALCDLKLYLSIEKRGFYLLIDGKPAECLNALILDGNKLIMKR